MHEGAQAIISTPTSFKGIVRLWHVSSIRNQGRSTPTEKLGVKCPPYDDPFAYHQNFACHK